MVHRTWNVLDIYQRFLHCNQMREIKFRGLCVNNPSKWAIGDLLQKKEPLIFERLQHTDDDKGFFFKVKKESIGQFTYQQDENGSEIYAGDVLSEKYKVLVYQDITGAFMIRFLVCPETNHGRSLFQYLKDRKKAGTQERDCVIIGNIIQNPELLK